MKSYELMPTNENLLSTYLNDTIARNIDIFRLVDILNSLDDSCSIAIDGNWGSGKTFFVKQIKMVMDTYNDFIIPSSIVDKLKIKKKFDKYKNQQDGFQNHISVYYDSWENDNDDDPVLSLIYSIFQSIQTDFSFNNGTDCLQIAASILEFFSGKKWIQLINAFKSEDPLEILKKEKNIQEMIKEFLDSLLIERGNRLVIFIDELDRCKPSYAVRLLERIKHYFSNDRITFVFSVNINELQHTIKQYYGSGFNACRYLDRFFDLRISLPPADLNLYYQSLNFNETDNLYDIVCAVVIRVYHFELREIAKYLRIAKIAAFKPTHNEDEYNFIFPSRKGLQIGLFFIVPIVIGLKICNSSRYFSFINGEDYKPLVEVCDCLGSRFFNFLLEPNESFFNNDHDKTLVTLELKLKNLYEAVFIMDYEGDTHSTKVGSLTFNKETREILLRITSLLSNYADINIE